MRAYRVLYDHRADEDSELSVSKGDIVLSADSPVDEWLEVALARDPERHGYVPSSFVNLLSPEESASYLPSVSSTRGGMNSSTLSGSRSSQDANLSGSFRSSLSLQGRPPSTVLGNSDSRLTLSDLSHSQSGRSTPSGSVRSTSLMTSQHGNAGGFSNRVSSKSLLGGAGAHSFADAFAQHEKYFQEVMKSREETFLKLEQSLSTTSSEIKQCQRKNEDLLQKIKELEALVEEEKRRWRDRIDAEKAALQSKLLGDTWSAIRQPVATSS